MNRSHKDHAQPKPLRVLWHWITMGPYHLARMGAVARQPGIELTVVEDCSLDDHCWVRDESESQLRVLTIAKGIPYADCDRRAIARRFGRILETEQPHAIVDGLGDIHCLGRVFTYIKSHPKPKLYLWSETTAWDRRRLWWREWAKRLLFAQYDGAFVAGTQHRLYLESLGFAPDRVVVVGGCVDNEFFRHRAFGVRRRQEDRGRIGTSKPYFVFVGRLIPEKNLRGLILEYSRYRQSTRSPWDLVIVGSGPQEPELRELAQTHCPEGVIFAGLKQTDELVIFYAWAGCLVLPSTSEPWGLVVNEAIASGVPVIVSDRCGSAHELVRHGQTGFTFHPAASGQLSQLLSLVSSGRVDLQALATRAAARLEQFTPERYGKLAVDLMLRLAQRPSIRHTLGRYALLLATNPLLAACRLAPGIAHSPPPVRANLG